MARAVLRPAPQPLAHQHPAEPPARAPSGEGRGQSEAPSRRNCPSPATLVHAPQRHPYSVPNNRPARYFTS
jgi:hypothetical protein